MDFDFIELIAAFELLDKVGAFFGGIIDSIREFFAGLFDGFLDFIRGLGRWAIWACVAILIVGGFAGTILPFLPGTTFILAGVCLHFFALGLNESGLKVQTLVIIAILYVLSIIVDSLSGAIGAKWFGSSKWGVIGAIVGGLVGLCFSLPGIIIGPLVGVFAFEMLFGKKQVKEAGNSTFGTFVGGGAGIIAGVTIGLLMIGFYLVDIFILK